MAYLTKRVFVWCAQAQIYGYQECAHFLRDALGQMGASTMLTL